MNACEDRTHDVCDVDVISNAQDWDLKRLPMISVRENRAGELTVISRFINDGDPEEVDYDFMLEDGAWARNDVAGVDERKMSAFG